jgi:phosphatidylinositol phospholipase C, delta
MCERQVQVHGVPADCHEHRTETIENNGFNPRWNHEMSFTVTCPELALVSFRVIDEETTNSDVTVAYYCLPFECMQKGYRMIALRDLKGNVVGDTSLFVHIAIEQPTKKSKAPSAAGESSHL